MPLFFLLFRKTAFLDHKIVDKSLKQLVVQHDPEKIELFETSQVSKTCEVSQYPIP
ncbi:hypothetical protein U14_03433 [Candidatus Moduliflexus flocculans]|uniref:Uncharacterized protein n=1 Tax=Candidatus Moduliflexus flocculans TaxID=1499966 RepID=A0A081BP66_9BACT|nr:hypothetical protein U14_03433 [Candidatus Moduliflexus flocculans]